MDGFFSDADFVSTKPVGRLPACGACGIYNECRSPKMPVTGRGQRKILVIGEAPGEEEDERNEQFVGKAGRLLRRTFEKFDVDLDGDCWKTNALICRPLENRTPTDLEVEHCRPNLYNAIDELDPDVVIPLGKVAVASLLGDILQEGVGGISRWAGWDIPLQKWNTWVVPTFHPSYVSRMEDDQLGTVVRTCFEQHLEKAFRHDSKPWTSVPDYSKEVEVVLDPEVAARDIRKMISDGGAVAFDYETNMIKPDSKWAEIVSCSVCWRGKKTIAYPWVGEAIKATSELLKSDLPKIGANTKFEDRWTRAKLGHPVNNWKWDGMLSAHHLDNRPDITSVKFQAFVRLGVAPWNRHVEPYLKQADSRGVNSIRHLDQRALLIYNGIDSLVEYLIAEDQKREMMEWTE